MMKVRSIRRPATEAPTLTWVPVTDSDGHVRMEMRWQVSRTRGDRRPSRAA